MNCKVIIKIFVLIGIIALSMSLFSCTKDDDSKETQLTYYSIKSGVIPERDDTLSAKLLIEEYNDYCDKVSNTLDASYKIKVVEFEDAAEMKMKLSTELMAGSGPDLFSLTSNLSVYKLIYNKNFADINELIKYDTSENKLNLDDYNKVIMNAGVFDGKRYVVPINYDANILIADKELFQNYNTVSEDSKEKQKFFKEHNITFTQSYEEVANIFYKLIVDNIDFKNKKTTFDDNFKEDLVELYEISSINNIKKGMRPIQDGSSLFAKDGCAYADNSMGCFSSGITFMADEYAYYTKYINPIVTKGLERDQNTSSAKILTGFMINANSKNKDKALEFIKYVLSKQVQGYYDEKEYKERLKTYQYGWGFFSSLPVRTQSFEDSITVAQKASYQIDLVVGIDNDFMNSYIDIVNKINYCEIPDDYYTKEILSDLLEQYFDGKLSTDAFIDKLELKTKIYLEE
ncbi:hypothetical protein AGMMS50284_7420 [Clostridia bacterium]|nr:hypothetical protein AGMMS50284_7420 [Clostridia bacterium]